MIDCEQVAYDNGFDEGSTLAITEPPRWHPSIVAMADAMQEKLDKNAHKDGWPTADGKRGWLKPNCKVEFLIYKLNEETRELRYAARRDSLHMTSRLEAVRLEAADVANIAMMIADNLGCYTKEE